MLVLPSIFDQGAGLTRLLVEYVRGVAKRRALLSIFDQLSDVTSLVMVYVIVSYCCEEN